jgi:hypothetical protein
MAKPWLSKAKLLAISKRHASGKTTYAQFSAEVRAFVRDGEAKLKKAAKRRK